MKRIIKLIPAFALSAALLAACGSAPTAATPTQPAATAAATGVAATSGPTAEAPTEAATAQTAAPSTDATSAPAETTTANVPTPTFAPPTAKYNSVAESLYKPIKESYPDTPVTVGVIAVEGDYAVALATPFGQKPQFAWLQLENEAWKTVFVGSAPSSDVLEKAGVPQSLMTSSDAYGVLEGFTAQLQNPRGKGVDGVVRAEGLVGDYARVSFSPSDPSVMDGFTAFWKRENGAWKQIAAGTADFGSLTEKGVPAELLGTR